MLMAVVIMLGNITIRCGLMVSRWRLFVLLAKRHRNRVQVLQRQPGNQHQQSKFFQ